MRVARNTWQPSLDREPELKIIRRAFAKQVMAACGVRDPRVVRWGGGYRTTPDPDPRII